jgi:lipopolysaccharide transport system ATP-binding protein
MSKIIIAVENLSKVYQLGQIGTGTFANDLTVWWARARGKPNPLLKIGQTDHGNRTGEEIWALKDVSFEVEQGEVLGIIGRNGAGKSTLLKILSRVTAPTSGRVKVKGRIASLLEVGTGFHPELTGRENISLNGAILGMTSAEVKRKFDEIVAFAEVEQFIDTPVKRYSSGMYVRLAFAVAAHLESEILLVDEVLAVGDVAFQKKCLGKMGDVAKEGRTVLFVSHNMQVIAQLCEKGILLHEGKIDPKNEIHPIVANYLSMMSNNDSSSGFVDLKSSKKNRSGNGNSRFTSISLSGCDGILKSTFQVGETMDIKLSCEIMIVDHTQFYQIRIASVSGTPIFHWVDFDDNLPSPSRPGIDTVIVQVDKLLLYPGRYHLNILVSDRYGTAYDFIENAISFDVEGGSLIQMSRQYFPSLGIIHYIPKWKRL